MYTDTWATLTWSPGDFAVSHDAYFGDNFDDVNDATTDSSTFAGNVTDAMLIVGFFGFPYPDGLVPGTTYYWRIDEVNDANVDSPWKGDVWSFWIPPRTAYDPIPGDGGKFVDPDVTLSWAAGFSATGGQFVPNTTYTPGTLESDKTYYWRVDESDGIATYTGNVWSFKTLPDIPVTDPNLVGWWKLDEATVAVDWSGHGNHGTLRGDPQQETGYHGEALAFDGRNDYVSVLMDVSETEYAAALWFKTTNGDCGLMAVVDSDLGNGGHDRHIYLTGGNIKIRLWDTEEIETTGLNLANGLWHHVVYTYGATIGGQKVYVDGVLGASGTKSASDFDWQRHVNIGFSNDAANTYFEGVLDDVRIYDKILTQAEVQQTMRGDLLAAWNASPKNNAIVDVDRAKQPLTWSRGDNAAQHDVYLGTDKDAVGNADASDATGIYRGRQTTTSYSPPEPLEWGTGPYYWRIDEFNTDGTISAGNIWSFTVADFLIVDDFESYNDIPEGELGSNRVYLAWIDGYDYPTVNGAVVGYLDVPLMEHGNVHGGSQAMPYSYENNFKSSQATLTLTSLRDWTRESVTTLSLWFYGDPANAPERMSVVLNGAAPVYHADPSAATIGAWTQWPIDLSTFGVPLTNVNSITIGFGVPGSTAAGGTGNMLFDDLQLIR
jgi:hypothetical protein